MEHTLWTISISRSCASSSTHCSCYGCPALNQGTRTLGEQLLWSQGHLSLHTKSWSWNWWELWLYQSEGTVPGSCWGQGRGQPPGTGSWGPAKGSGHRCGNRFEFMLFRWTAGEPWSFLGTKPCATWSSRSEELGSILSGGIPALDR